MLRIGASDRTAYAVLVDRHLGLNLAFATRLIGDRSEAEDVMQEAFVRVWKYASRWDPARKTRFTTWFYRVVMNLCFDVKRKRKMTMDMDAADNVAADDISAERYIDKQQRAGQVADALIKLPDRQRVAVTLFYMQELSNKQAAEVMDVSLNAFESLLVRARRKLGTILAPDREQILKEIV